MKRVEERNGQLDEWLGAPKDLTAHGREGAEALEAMQQVTLLYG